MCLHWPNESMLMSAPLAAEVPSISVAVVTAAAAAEVAVATSVVAVTTAQAAPGAAAAAAPLVLAAAEVVGVAVVTAAVGVTVVAARRCLSYAHVCGLQWISTTSTLCSAMRMRTNYQRFFAHLAGPLPRSAGGCTYILCIVDDYTSFGVLNFLKDKIALRFPTRSAPPVALPAAPHSQRTRTSQ